jgi:hypothetical protein
MADGAESRDSLRSGTRRQAGTQMSQMDHQIAIVLNRDLLFGSQIRHALSRLGMEAHFVRDGEQFVTALKELRERAVIGIIDMNGPVAWDIVQAALSGAENVTPTLAFGPHVDVDGRRAAKAAGVTRIVSNGQFHQDMAALIERYRRR